MDPPDTPPPADESPPVKVLLPVPGTTPTQDAHIEESGEQPAPQPRRRPGRRLYLLALSIALLGLVGLATWLALARQGGSAPRADAPSEVPKDAIARINSSTPMPSPVLRLQPDSVGELRYQPEWEGWSQPLLEARRAQEEGRYSSAITQYAALVTVGSPQEARDALWGLASAYAASGQSELAIPAYTLFATLDDPRAVRALFRIGQLFEGAGHYQEAGYYYSAYISAGGPAKHAVQIRLARLLGDAQNAEQLYQAVLDDHPEDIDLRQALTGLAEVKSRRGDHAGALKLYDRLAALATSQPRPILDHSGKPGEVLAAEEAQQLGQGSDARKRLLAYIGGGGDYPFGRYSALTSLLKIDPTAIVSGTFSPILAGRIAYDAGYYGKAIEYLDLFRSASPDAPERPAAALLTGKAFELSGDAASAYNWYTATVQTYPASSQAPEASRRAGDILEEQASWDAALSVYQEALTRYPNAGDQTALTRVHSAVLAYRLEQRDLALNIISPLLSSQELSPTIKAQVVFWGGKLQKVKGEANWRSTLGQVFTLSPGSFLDFRARSVLTGEPEGGPLVPTFSEGKSKLGIQYAQEAGERTALLTWAAGLPAARNAVTATLPITATASITVSQFVALRIGQDAEAQRAVALLNLGDEAGTLLSLRALAERLRAEGDAVGLVELVMYLRYHASTYTSMRVAQTLADMDKGDPLKRPPLLLKTLYPTPYAELVLQEARIRDIDPLAMYALMRQESQFIPDAHSGADARGLAQVIPSTAAGIAEHLGDAQFTANDLYLPYVSVRYGTYYLASNLPQFDRKLLPTLAAYNGGPGNADRWLAGSALFDPDLYIERIDLFETADYLERVYQNYGFYKQIYAP